MRVTENSWCSKECHCKKRCTTLIEHILYMACYLQEGFSCQNNKKKICLLDDPCSGSISFLSLYQHVKSSEQDFRSGPIIPALSSVFSSENLLPFLAALNHRCPFFISYTWKMASHSPSIFFQYSSLLPCKDFHLLPHPASYCSVLNSAHLFPSFWRFPHCRHHCSVFLSHTAWGSDPSFLRLLLCTKASSNAWPFHMKKCDWKRYDYLASPRHNKIGNGLRPSIHTCFFGVT